MTPRQRFLAQMSYQPVDRSCLYDFSCWDECIEIWQKQGLPQQFGRDRLHEYFGLDATLGANSLSEMHAGVATGLCPPFAGEVLEDLGETERVRQDDGVIVIRGKKPMSIPMHVGHTLVDRASWDEHYKPRLNPDTPQRYPDDWEDRVKLWQQEDRALPCGVPGGSLFGKLRDWMGLENIAMVPYDDPAWFEEMVTTLADVSIDTLTRIFETGGRFDYCEMWEDMACNSGPLLSPAHFKQFLVPHYRRITDLCRANGIEVIYLDCDGWIDALIPLWMDAGVNGMFPLEVGTWNADPVDLRARFGKDLLLMGGFDKRILAKSPDAITAEVRRLAPLVEQGGYIGFCDHRVPPDVSLANYVHYAKTVREIWGKGVDLPPMSAPSTPTP